MTSNPDDKTPRKRERLPQEKPETAVLPSQRRRLLAAKGKDTDVPNSEERELLLVVRGMIERLDIPEDGSLVLGRSDHQARSHPDVDLTPYGALDRGVSRVHARIHIEDDRLFITDLGSKNGTFMGGDRLTPHEAVVVRKDAELLLGRLAIALLFR